MGMLKVAAALAAIWAPAAIAQTLPASNAGKLIIDIPSIAASTVGPNPTVPAPEKRRIICRSDYQIGSLVKKVRRCGDAEMWSRASRANRDMVDVLQQSGLIQQQEGLDPDRAGPVITQGYTPR